MFELLLSSANTKSRTSHALPMRRLGLKKLGGDTGQLTLANHKDVPYQMTS